MMEYECKNMEPLGTVDSFPFLQLLQTLDLLMPTLLKYCYLPSTKLLRRPLQVC